MKPDKLKAAVKTALQRSGAFIDMLRFAVSLITLKRAVIASIALILIYSALFSSSTHFMTQQESDQRIAQACAQATQAYLKDKAGSVEFLNMRFAEDSFLKGGYRKVALSALQSDEKFDREVQFQCTFESQLVWFGYDHKVKPALFIMGGAEFYAKDAAKTDAPRDLIQMMEAVQHSLQETAIDHTKGALPWLPRP